MALGSLVDAGADLDEVGPCSSALPVAGWALEAEPVLRAGVAATKVHVRWPRTPPWCARYAHITGARSTRPACPTRVRDRAQATFAALAEAEGRLHRRPPEQVHFHEVGGVDAIVDVVGTCAALEVLGVDRVTSSPVATGLGMVRTAHGMLPNPAPAVVELLRGAPTYGRDDQRRADHAHRRRPAGRHGHRLRAAARHAVGATGLRRRRPRPRRPAQRDPGGAGRRRWPRAGSRPEPGQPVVLLEANVDDATGEVLAHAVAALLDAGAHDAWITPIVMKKGRPAHTVSALADPALAAQLAARAHRPRPAPSACGARRLERWPAARADGRGRGRRPAGAGQGGRRPGEGRARRRGPVARRTGLPLREVLPGPRRPGPATGPTMPAHPEAGGTRRAGHRASAQLLEEVLAPAEAGGDADDLGQLAAGRACGRRGSGPRRPGSARPPPTRRARRGTGGRPPRRSGTSGTRRPRQQGVAEGGHQRPGSPPPRR